MSGYDMGGYDGSTPASQPLSGPSQTVHLDSGPRDGRPLCLAQREIGLTLTSSDVDDVTCDACLEKHDDLTDDPDPVSDSDSVASEDVGSYLSDLLHQGVTEAERREISDQRDVPSSVGHALAPLVREQRKAQVRQRLFTDAEFHNAVESAAQETVRLLDLDAKPWQHQVDFLRWAAALALLAKEEQ